MTAAMAAWATRTHTRAEGSRHHRAAGPAGAHAGRKWSWKNDHSFGTARTAGAIHAVRTERVIVPGNEGPGEEYDGHDENRAGDYDYPGRGLIEARMPRYERRRRGAGGRRRLELGLGCLGHPSIMPTSARPIKQRAQGVAEPLSA